jgi:hypothetical protein
MIAVASGEQDLSIHEVATGRKRLTLPTKGKGWVRCVAFSADGAFLAAGVGDVVYRWGVWSGQEVGRFAGHRGPVRSVTFTSTGKALLSGSTDTTVLVWDLCKVRRPIATAPPLVDRTAGSLWEALGDADAAKAYEAMRALAAKPARAVALLRGRLRPVAALDAQRREEVQRLIRGLDDDAFEVRQGASRQLQQLGESIEPVLQLAQKRERSAEVLRRLDRLLRVMAVRHEGPEGLREQRSLEILERLGSVKSRRLLEILAAGAPDARLTLAAKASLRRLGKPGRDG